MQAVIEFLTLTQWGLLLNVVGTIMVAISVGKNPGDAHQIVNGREIYLASVLHQKLFYCGLVVIILGFGLQFID